MIVYYQARDWGLIKMGGPKKGNWEKIVRDIKAGPHFGIHGTRRENLSSILESQTSSVSCHYFVVGENEKKLPDNEFYERLLASLEVTLRFSSGLKITGNMAEFTGLPSILLGIAKGYFGRFNNSNPDTSVCSFYGKKRKTFPVEHDFYGIPELLRLVGVVIEEPEIKRINQKLKRYSDGLGVVQWKEISNAYFVQGEIIKSFIGKIHERLK